MSNTEAKLQPEEQPDRREEVPSLARPPAAASGRRLRVVPFLITLLAVALAVRLSLAMWDAYMAAPWTRDGTMRVYVVTMAPEVAGRIVELPVADNQFVHKGDLLMTIDPANYRIAVALAEAAVKQAEATAQNASREAKRREQESDLAVTAESRETYQANAAAAQAQVEQAKANRDQARVNLERTQIHSPVNGWVTNLTTQLGDYATVGANKISVVDSDSFWVDGYFQETNLAPIRVGDPAEIRLMGYSEIVRGTVASITRGIAATNTQSDAQGLETINPIFTWVRLAQRIPVRIHIDHVPDSVTLVAGMTATVRINPRSVNREQSDSGQRLWNWITGFHPTRG